MGEGGEGGDKEKIEVVGGGNEKETGTVCGDGGILVGSSNQPVTREVDGDWAAVAVMKRCHQRVVGVGEGLERVVGAVAVMTVVVMVVCHRVRGELERGMLVVQWVVGSGGAGERRVERVQRTRRAVAPVRPPVTRSSRRRQSGEPKGKGIAQEMPTSPQIWVGISLEDYAVHASQDAVMTMKRDNPNVLAAVQEKLRESREAEVASWQATLKEEEVVAFAEEFEEEERATRPF